MKYRRDGSEQIQIGGRKPPYTLYVRATNESAVAIRNGIERLQDVRRRHQARVDAVTAEIDDLERQLDALLAVADETNDEMHAVVVRQPPEWINRLRQFVWREPSVAELRRLAAAKGMAAGGSAPTAA